MFRGLFFKITFLVLGISSFLYSPSSSAQLPSCHISDEKVGEIPQLFGKVVGGLAKVEQDLKRNGKEYPHMYGPGKATLLITKQIIPWYLDLRSRIERYSYDPKHLDSSLDPSSTQDLIANAARLILIRNRILSYVLKLHHQGSPIKREFFGPPRRGIESLDVYLEPYIAENVRNLLLSSTGEIEQSTIKMVNAQSQCGSNAIRFETADIDLIQHEYQALSRPASPIHYSRAVQLTALSKGVMNRGYMRSLFGEKAVHESSVSSCGQGLWTFSQSGGNKISMFPLAREDRQYDEYVEVFAGQSIQVAEALQKLKEYSKFDFRQIVNSTIFSNKFPWGQQTRINMTGGDIYDTESIPFAVDEYFSGPLAEAFNEKSISLAYLGFSLSFYEGDVYHPAQIAKRSKQNYEKYFRPTIKEIVNGILDLQKNVFLEVEDLEEIKSELARKLDFLVEVKGREVQTIIQRTLESTRPSPTKIQASKLRKKLEEIEGLVNVDGAVLLRAKQFLNKEIKSVSKLVDLQPSSFDEFSSVIDQRLSNPKNMFLDLKLALSYLKPLRVLVGSFYSKVEKRIGEFLKERAESLQGRRPSVKQLKELKQEVRQKIWQIAYDESRNLLVRAGISESDFYNPKNQARMAQEIRKRLATQKRFVDENKFSARASLFKRAIDQADLSEESSYTKVAQDLTKLSNQGYRQYNLNERDRNQLKAQSRFQGNVFSRYDQMLKFKRLDVAIYRFLMLWNLHRESIPEKVSFISTVDEAKILNDLRLKTVLGKEPLLGVPMNSNKMNPNKTNPSIHNDELAYVELAQYIHPTDFTISTKSLRSVMEKVFLQARQKTKGVVEKWCVADSIHYNKDANFQEMFRTVPDVRDSLRASLVFDAIIQQSDDSNAETVDVLERVNKYDAQIAKVSRSQMQKIIEDIVEPVVTVISIAILIVSIYSGVIFGLGMITLEGALANIGIFGGRAVLLAFLSSFGLRLGTLFYDQPAQLKQVRNVGQSFVAGDNTISWEDYQKERKANAKNRKSGLLYAEGALNLFFAGQIVNQTRRMMGLKISKSLKRFRAPAFSLVPSAPKLKTILKKPTLRAKTRELKKALSFPNNYFTAKRFQPYNRRQIDALFKGRLYDLAVNHLGIEQLPKILKMINRKITKIESRLRDVVVVGKNADEVRIEKALAYGKKRTWSEWLEEPKLSAMYFMPRAYFKSLLRGELSSYYKAVYEYKEIAKNGMAKNSSRKGRQFADFMDRINILRGKQIESQLENLKSLQRKLEELNQAGLALKNRSGNPETAEKLRLLMGELFKLQGPFALSQREIFTLKAFIAPSYPRMGQVTAETKNLFSRFYQKLDEALGVPATVTRESVPYKSIYNYGHMSKAGLKDFQVAFKDYFELQFIKHQPLFKSAGSERGFYETPFLNPNLFYQFQASGRASGANSVLGQGSMDPWARMSRAAGKMKNLMKHAGKSIFPLLTLAWVGNNRYEEYKVHKDHDRWIREQEALEDAFDEISDLYPGLEQITKEEIDQSEDMKAYITTLLVELGEVSPTDSPEEIDERINQVIFGD